MVLGRPMFYEILTKQSNSCPYLVKCLPGKDQGGSKLLNIFLQNSYGGPKS